MDEETEKYIIGSIGRYRPGGMSFSKNPSQHSSLENAVLELRRLKASNPGVKFKVFKLPLQVPFTPMDISHLSPE